MIEDFTLDALRTLQKIHQRTVQRRGEREASFHAAGWRYFYEPTCIHLPQTFKNGRPHWRGPHRFAHAHDRAHPNHGQPVPNEAEVLGWLYKGSEERLRWCQEQFGFEGVGKRDRWTRVCAFQFVFQREDDAFAFKMRWL